MIYTVYVLYSRVHDQIYVGQTSNLIQRVHSHNTYGKDWTRTLDKFHAKTVLHFHPLEVTQVT